MDLEQPDIQKFQFTIFRQKNVLGTLLSFCRKSLNARQAGLMFGTDHSGVKFLPPYKWDRGVVHKLDGKGFSGSIFRWIGPTAVKFKGLSPVRFYRTSQYGDKIENEGVIAYVLRKHQDYYEKGIKILVINNVCLNRTDDSPLPVDLPVLSFDGNRFDPVADIRVDRKIIKNFRPDNFLSAYVPDYGAIIFNTVDRGLMETREDNRFTHEKRLKKRLNLLIQAIEAASLAHLGMAKGRPASKLIWRKERRLRKTMAVLKAKEAELDEQKRHLMAVGAVKPSQLKMTPVSVSKGVFGFLDMVGSVGVRERIRPRQYFMILNFCHEIAAETAARFSCRVDNFIGDAVFIQNLSLFDDPDLTKRPGDPERSMLMVCAMASMFNEIHSLCCGTHPMDREKRVKTLVTSHGIQVHFRAGLEIGSALVGPLGSSRRRIVTAIGVAVNTAARLESTGKPNKIHVSKEFLTILENNVVSRDTAMIREIGVSKGIFPGRSSEAMMNFFDFYSKLFNLQGPVIQENTNAAYKEFSRDITYYLQCIPDQSVPKVCSGI